MPEDRCELYRSQTTAPAAALSSSLQALLWDVDGTLAETERDGHRSAFNRAFAEVGVDLHWDPERYGELLAVTGGRERITAALRELRGHAPDPAEVEALQTAKQRHYAELVEAGELVLKPGVAELMRQAAEAGLCQAIVTTSGRAAVEALARRCLGDLAELLELWVCGGDVGRKKPDPEGYHLALARLDLPASAALALEDSGNGLRAAVGAGLGCVITLSHYGTLEPADTFDAALAVVEGLGAAGRVARGPACGPDGVTLSYLQQLRAGAC